MIDNYQNSSGFMNYRTLNIYVAGDVNNTNSSITRIVHISDTRGAESCYLNQIPKGDILIHSGDFSSHTCHTNDSKSSTNWRTEIAKLNRFFKATQHRYKIFVPGCWDFRNENRPTAEEIQRELTEAIYLEDAQCRLMGLNIYGLPWIASDDLRLRHDQPFDGNHGKRGNYVYRKFRKKKKPLKPDKPNGFILPKFSQLIEKYKMIPKNLDICISHSPAWRDELSDIILNEKKPILHLSGHDFSSYGVMWRKGILFSNAAVQLSCNFPLIPRPRKSSLEPISTSSSRKKFSSQSNSSNLGHTDESQKNFLFKRIMFQKNSSDGLKNNGDIQSNSTINSPNNGHINPGNGSYFLGQKNSQKRPARWKRKLCTKLMNTPTILTMDENHSAKRNGTTNTSPYIGWGTEPTMIGRFLSRFCCSFLRRKDFGMPYGDNLMIHTNNEENSWYKYSTTQSSYISLENTPTSQAARVCARKDAAETCFIVEPLFHDASSMALTTLSLYSKNSLCSPVNAHPRDPIVFDLYHELDPSEKDVLPKYSFL